MHVKAATLTTSVALVGLIVLAGACTGGTPPPPPTQTPSPPVVQPTGVQATPTSEAAAPAAPTATIVAPLTRVTVAVPPLGIQLMALTTAIEGGFFERHGVAVSLFAATSAPEVMMAVRQGRAEFAVVPLMQVVQSLDSPRPIAAVGAVAGSHQLNVVVAAGVARERGLTASSPLDQRLRGLDGLRVGHPAGPLAVNTVRVVLQAAGIATGDVELIVVPGEQQVAALARGDIDAFFGHHPYLEQAIVDEGAVLLLHLSSGEVESVGFFPMQVLAVAGAPAAGTVTAVLAALAEAQQAILDDPTVAMQALRSAFPDLGAPLLEEGLRIYLPSVPATPEITPEAYAVALGLFGLGEVAFERVVDGRFLPGR